MKEKILKISRYLEEGAIDENEAKQALLNLFGVSGSYCRVYDKEPPHNVELIAKAPDGTVYLTSWRPAYGIFTCQCKSESAFDWEWKVV